MRRSQDHADAWRRPPFPSRPSRGPLNPDVSLPILQPQPRHLRQLTNHSLPDCPPPPPSLSIHDRQTRRTHRLQASNTTACSIIFTPPPPIHQSNQGRHQRQATTTRRRNADTITTHSDSDATAGMVRVLPEAVGAREVGPPRRTAVRAGAGRLPDGGAAV
jgi:hypothetical protein